MKKLSTSLIVGFGRGECESDKEDEREGEERERERERYMKIVYCRNSQNFVVKKFLLK